MYREWKTASNDPMQDWDMVLSQDQDSSFAWDRKSDYISGWGHEEISGKTYAGCCLMCLVSSAQWQDVKIPLLSLFGVTFLPYYHSHCYGNKITYTGYWLCSLNNKSNFISCRKTEWIVSPTDLKTILELGTVWT